MPVKEQSLCIPDPCGKGERNSFFCSSHPVSKRAENDTRCLLVKAQELTSSSRNSACGERPWLSSVVIYLPLSLQ